MVSLSSTHTDSACASSIKAPFCFSRSQRKFVGWLSTGQDFHLVGIFIVHFIGWSFGKWTIFWDDWKQNSISNRVYHSKGHQKSFIRGQWRWNTFITRQTIASHILSWFRPWASYCTTDRIEATVRSSWASTIAKSISSTQEKVASEISIISNTNSDCSQTYCWSHGRTIRNNAAKQEYKVTRSVIFMNQLINVFINEMPTLNAFFHCVFLNKKPRQYFLNYKIL